MQRRFTKSIKRYRGVQAKLQLLFVPISGLLRDVTSCIAHVALL